MDLTGFRWWTRKFVLLPIQHYFSPLHTKIIFQMPVKLQLHHHPTSSAAHKRLSLRFSQTFIKLNYMIFSCSRKDVEDWGMRSGEREAQHFFACCWRRKEKTFLRPHRISDLECFSSFSTFFSSHHPPGELTPAEWKFSSSSPFLIHKRCVCGCSYEMYLELMKSEHFVTLQDKFFLDDL